MRCASCNRMLLRPGTQVQLQGGPVTVGPRCAEKLIYGELGRPRRARTVSAPRRRRAAGQQDLFGAVA